jgi:hypothetical protein
MCENKVYQSETKNHVIRYFTTGLQVGRNWGIRILPYRGKILLKSRYFSERRRWWKRHSLLAFHTKSKDSFNDWNPCKSPMTADGFCCWPYRPRPDKLTKNMHSHPLDDLEIPVPRYPTFSSWINRLFLIRWSHCQMENIVPTRLESTVPWTGVSRS